MARLVRGGAWVPAAAALAATLAAGDAVAGQSPPFSSTLRYGSGYFDVPAAAVLPNMGFRAGWSGFWVRSDGDPVVDGSGAVTDPGGARRSFHGDGTFSVGILGRAELGTSLQSFSSSGEGGRMVGAFGKLLLLDPSSTGLGLAVGARYVGGPDFEDGVDRAPGRLGFPDPRLRRTYAGGVDVDTRFSFYGVGTLQLPGPRAGWLPENDVTLTLGYGTGMFREGGDLAWYGPPGWDGWFLAGGMDLALGRETVLTLEAEHTGFDVNVGAEVARGGARIGIHALGINHDGGVSPWRSRKLGISMSLTACPLLKRACRPGLRARPPADTVRLPAPPPDTVRLAPAVRDTARGYAEAGGLVPEGRGGLSRSGGLPSAPGGSPEGIGPGRRQGTTFSRTRFRASSTAMAEPRVRSSSSHAFAPRRR